MVSKMNRFGIASALAMSVMFAKHDDKAGGVATMETTETETVQENLGADVSDLPQPLEENTEILRIKKIPAKDRSKQDAETWQAFRDENSRRVNAISARRMKAFSAHVSDLLPNENGNVDEVAGLGIMLVQAISASIDKKSQAFKEAKGKGTSEELAVVIAHDETKAPLMEEALHWAERLIALSKGIASTDLALRASYVLGYNGSKAGNFTTAVREISSFAKAK